jgi:hypothetical protein
MTNVFVTKQQLVLKNGGYLVANEVPVNHDEFVNLQNEARYLVSLAEKVKNTDFTVKTVKTFSEVVNEVKNQLNSEKKTYVTKPESVSTPITDSLKNEALEWLRFQNEGTKSEKLNNILQKFNLISEFEEFGLYFSTDKIVKLNKIYSVEEIVDAVKVLEPHLS